MTIGNKAETKHTVKSSRFPIGMFLNEHVSEFLSGLRERGNFEEMFEILPDIYFYIKDNKYILGFLLLVLKYKTKLFMLAMVLMVQIALKKE